MQKKLIPSLGILGLIALAATIFDASCETKAENKNELVAEQPKKLSHAELVSRGQYKVMTSMCNDCHSPKIFSPHGFSFDSSRLLSGHPANDPIPAINKKALTPGEWVLFSADLTAAVGPWGLTYSANLTPDSATGIGAWSVETFIKAMRTGKHLGQENGRPIMPPMPWELVGKMTDEDLTAIYTYLQELPAINNRVPVPVPPGEVAKMR
jgi:hypothetical protein